MHLTLAVVLGENSTFQFFHLFQAEIKSEQKALTETIQDNTAIIEKKTELLRQKQVLVEKEAAFEDHWSRVSKGPYIKDVCMQHC